MKSEEQYNWDYVYDANYETFAASLLRIKRSQQWCYIENAIRRKHGNFNNLRSIEIGSGMGKVSALLALMGVNVTLVDNNKKALELAGNLFSYIGCKGKFVYADALALPEALWNNYDIALSLGTGEHFTGVNRKRIIESHYKVLKTKGVVFFIVPNAACLRYNVLMNISAFSGGSLEKEFPFSKKELVGLAQSVGFANVYAVGLNYKEAKERFKFGSLVRGAANQYFPRLTRYIRKLRKREHLKTHQDVKQINFNECRETLITPILELKASRFDNLFGYAIMLTGEK